MIIHDEAILIAKYQFGDSSNILTLFTKEHGIQKGLLKGANSSKIRHVLSLGNILSITKMVRLEEQLGILKVDLQESNLANIFYNNTKLLALTTMCSLIEEFIPMQEISTPFYLDSKDMIANLNKDDFLLLYANWELLLLNNIGFGLDFSKCVVSDAPDIYYLSPKSGKSVSKTVGEPYKDKLFIIPQFITNKTTPKNIQDILNLLDITTHFLQFFCTEYNKKIPNMRNLLLKNLATLF